MKGSVRTVEELAADESFQNYCLNRSKKDVRKWERKLKQNSRLRSNAEEATFLVHMFAPKNVVVKEKVVKLRTLKVVKICAVFILLFVAGFLLQGQLKDEISEVIKVANEGNIEIHLSDLTKVHLRKGGSIRYKESWENSKEREVWLEGEAYFEVTKSKPFSVHLDQGSVRVLGTKFLVKSDPEETEIVLEEGKVNFITPEKVFEMVPGDMLQYNSQQVSIASKTNIDEFHSWRKSSLAFENRTLAEVIRTINNSYDIEVVLGNPKLKDRKITTTINQNDPLLLLSAIAEIYGIKMISKNDKVILE